ncbi:MAG: hypothetical protein ABH840_02550 [Nanoarchaeota archaeon]
MKKSWVIVLSLLVLFSIVLVYAQTLDTGKLILNSEDEVNGEIVSAENLNVGDTFYLEDGRKARVSGIEGVVGDDNSVDFNNLNFFANGVLVHNKMKLVQGKLPEFYLFKLDADGALTFVSPELVITSAQRKLAAETLVRLQGQLSIDTYFARTYNRRTLKDMFISGDLTIDQIFKKAPLDIGRYPGLDKVVWTGRGDLSQRMVAQYAYATDAAKKIEKGLTRTSLFYGCKPEVKGPVAIVSSIDDSNLVKFLSEKAGMSADDLTEIGNIGIFPFTDEVLPGHVIGETITTARASGKTKIAVLVPQDDANVYLLATRLSKEKGSALHEITTGQYKLWADWNKEPVTLDSGWVVQTFYNTNPKPGEIAKSFYTVSGDLYGVPVNAQIDDVILFGDINEVMKAPRVGLAEIAN